MNRCASASVHDDDAWAGAEYGQRPVVGEAIKDPNNRIAKLLTTEKDNAKIIDDLYLSILNRPPTSAEMNEAIKAFQDGEADYSAAVAEHAKRVAALTAYEKGMDAGKRNGKRICRPSRSGRSLTWRTPRPKAERILTKQPDGSILASGPNPSRRHIRSTPK